MLVESKGTKPVPVDITITYLDGSTEKIHRSIAVWEKGNKSILVNFTTDKKIRSVNTDYGVHVCSQSSLATAGCITWGYKERGKLAVNAVVNRYAPQMEQLDYYTGGVGGASM